MGIEKGVWLVLGGRGGGEEGKMDGEERGAWAGEEGGVEEEVS